MMIVIKLGGAVGIDYASCCKNISYLVKEGFKVVVVHGGSDIANNLGEQLGVPPVYITSTSGVTSRYTNSDSLDILNLAMKGRLNPLIVEQLLKYEVKAIGLSGIDGMLIQAQKKSAIKAVFNGKTQIIRDDLTGKITKINSELITMLLDLGYIPVISPPAYDPNYGAINVDADRTAAAIAQAINAECLLLMSNIPGLMTDCNDVESIIHYFTHHDIEKNMKYAKGRMKLKLIASSEAFLNQHLKKVIIADGRQYDAIQKALNGQGTIIERAVEKETRIYEQ